MKKNFSIKEKIALGVGILVALIVALVALSVFSLQILTATEPDSPAAAYGLSRALILVAAFGLLSIGVGVWMLVRLPASVNRPFEQLSKGLEQVANHNYKVSVELPGGEAMRTLSQNFNRMARRLDAYHNSSVSALNSSRRYLETVINSIDEPLVCIDNAMHLLVINRAASAVLNLVEAETEGKSAHEVAMRNDLLRRLLNGLADEQAAANAHKTANKEPLKIYADNKESYFQVKYLPVRMKANACAPETLQGTVILLKNITEFHKLNMAKTTFISTISHELKTPVSAILMSLQLLADKRVGSLNDEQRELSDSIRDNGERLLTIIGELLNMTQVESGVLQLKPIVTKPIELIEYAIKANRVQAEKFNINIEVDYPREKIGKLYVDSEKIAWVLTNLLSNAVRYSAEGGRVVIGAAQPNAHCIEIFVQDFGKGIDPRYHDSIFERYFRVPGTKIQGSGLGLSISRDFVEAHGGTLTIDSAPGLGSRFIVRLPV